jgi:hypothetical protein
MPIQFYARQGLTVGSSEIQEKCTNHGNENKAEPMRQENECVANRMSEL